MSGDIYVYDCECGVEIRAETYDPQELPKLWCPDCGDLMEISIGAGPE